MKKNTFDGACPCQDTSILVLNRTSVSRIVAGATLACFFIFVTGYFWGKKHAAESFMTAVNEEALVDRAQVAINTIAPIGSAVDTVPDNNEEEVAEVELSPQQEQAVPDVAPSDKLYLAQLVGFGNQRNANQFVRKLARRGVTEVEVSPRTSRMNSGKMRTWYQVVTKPFADHQQVVALVDRIKQIEKLHDVRIIAQNA